MKHSIKGTVTREHEVTMSWKDFTEKLGFPEDVEISTFIPGCDWGAGSEEQYNCLSRRHDVTIRWTETVRTKE